MRTETTDRPATPHEAVMDDGVDPNVVQRSYREFLDIISDVVEELINQLSGRTVVTADHGELFHESVGRRAGELCRWGHPPLTPVQPLVEVPWWVLPRDERKQVRGGSADRQGQRDLNTNRLEALGHR